MVTGAVSRIKKLPPDEPRQQKLTSCLIMYLLSLGIAFHPFVGIANGSKNPAVYTGRFVEMR